MQADFVRCARRLVSILLMLQTRERMTAQELADALEVSPCTIYRDMESLGAARGAGIEAGFLPGCPDRPGSVGVRQLSP